MHIAVVIPQQRRHHGNFAGFMDVHATTSGGTALYKRQRSSMLLLTGVIPNVKTAATSRHQLDSTSQDGMLHEYQARMQDETFMFTITSIAVGFAIKSLLSYERLTGMPARSARLAHTRSHPLTEHKIKQALWGELYTAHIRPHVHMGTCGKLHVCPRGVKRRVSSPFGAS